jgi:hypothetical protein
MLICAYPVVLYVLAGAPYAVFEFSLVRYSFPPCGKLFAQPTSAPVLILVKPAVTLRNLRVQISRQTQHISRLGMKIISLGFS